MTKRLLEGLSSAVLLLALTLAQQANANTSGKTSQLKDEQVAQLVQQCAPEVHPNTMMKIIRHESGFRPYVIGVNQTPRAVFDFDNPRDAAVKARELIAQGKSIDMGLGQINSTNLRGLGMTPEQVFEPCENIKAAARILTEAYSRTSVRFAGELALDQALSIYNTGRTDRGIANGYVARVRAARYTVPALDAGAVAPPAAQEAQPEGPPPPWDVFAVARYRGAQSAPPPPPPPQAQERPQAQQAAMLFNEP